MGADLYLEPVFSQNRDQWEPLFNQAVKRRDRLPEDSAEWKDAQAEVELYFRRMRSRGYFGDSYNNWDMLRNFGLSWWGDVIPMLDRKQCLSPARARRLCVMLSEREPAFEQNLSELSVKDRRYFRRRYREFRLFMDEATKRNLPIRCSL